MKHKVRLSRQAAADMQAVLEHTLQFFGPKKHEEYKALIGDALRHIALTPVDWPAKCRPEIAPDVFTIHIAQRRRPARHVFVYRVAGSPVRVLRLLHDSMDIARHIES